MHIPFCPVEPTPKQALFLSRDEKEVFFGGAAGGGKSAALLMAALQHVEQAGYAALIVRKDMTRLMLSGGLLPRSHEWLAVHNDVKWSMTRKQWTFPSGATITFGYLARPLDKYRYASAEFQYIAFDELTDFNRDDYLFLFGRLRKQRGMNVPLRVRSASNPGGPGHAWVKERFIPSEAAGGDREEGTLAELFGKDSRLYIPSRIRDNPWLDAETYRESLAELPPIERERMMHGDWSVHEEGIFRAEWLRYYAARGQLYDLLDANGQVLASADERSCRRFITIDPAGTSEERSREIRGKGACYTAALVWDQPPGELARFLVLVHVERVRVAFSELCNLVRTMHARWKADEIWIEDEKLGQAVFSSLELTHPIRKISTDRKDKYTRSTALQNMMSEGRIFLPRLDNSWRPAFEAELLAWRGTNHEVADQIDAAAYAAIVARQNPNADIVILPFHRS